MGTKEQGIRLQEAAATPQTDDEKAVGRVEPNVVLDRIQGSDAADEVKKFALSLQHAKMSSLGHGPVV